MENKDELYKKSNYYSTLLVKTLGEFIANDYMTSFITSYKTDNNEKKCISSMEYLGIEDDAFELYNDDKTLFPVKPNSVKNFLNNNGLDMDEKILGMKTYDAYKLLTTKRILNKSTDFEKLLIKIIEQMEFNYMLDTSIRENMSDLAQKIDEDNIKSNRINIILFLITLGISIIPYLL